MQPFRFIRDFFLGGRSGHQSDTGEEGDLAQGNGRADPGAVIYAQNLTVLSDLIERDLTGNPPVPLDPTTMQQIALARGILKPLAGPPPGWNAIDEAELRLFGVMPDGLLRGELATQVARAEILGVVGLDAIKAKLDDAALTEDDRRHMGIALLQRMYNRYEERRADRFERRKVDGRMLVIAFSVFAVFVMAVVLMILAGMLGFDPMGQGAAEAAAQARDGTLATTSLAPASLGARAMRGLACLSVFHLIVVPYFGVVGALFSRFIEYRTNRATLGREALWGGYSVPVTWGRLMVGALAALLFYFLVSGNLLNGEMFFDAKDAFLWVPSDTGVLFPNADFYRLIIWSAIAGFAEHLVPERFDTLAAGDGAGAKPASGP